MPSRKELFDSIKPEMRLTKNFFLKVFAYDMTTPGFSRDVISQLELCGCTKANEYYTCVVSEWRHEHDKAMDNVAKWYRKQDFNRMEEESRKRQEVEQLKADLQKKSDRELLNLLQNLA